jgi:hypothetical protein
VKTRSKIFGALVVGALAAALNVAGAGVAHAAQATTSVKPAAGIFQPIRNVGNGKCLQPEGGSTALFAAIVQEPCDGSSAQGWQYVRVATNHYHLANQASGLCLQAWDGAFNNGRVLQDECNFASNNEFNTNTALPNVVILESRVGFRDTGFCVDVPGAQAIDGLALQIWQCNGTLAQRWVVGFA